MAKPFATEHDQPPEFRAALKRVREDKELAERARKPYIERWNEFYGLHRNYSRYAKALTEGEAGRDEIFDSAKREFGAQLFIPYVFGVIETMVPRVLSENPRLVVKARSLQLGYERAEAVRKLFEERQNEIDYALKLTPVARRGLKYGLGVAKTLWDREEHTFTSIERGIFGQRKVGQKTDVIEGPDMDDVDQDDFFWDPPAKNIKTCRFAIHRTWRDFRYIRERVESGDWLPIDLERVKGMGSDTDRGTMLRERAVAAGLKGFDTNLGRLHEVLEWHDGDQVVTVLDNQLVVQMAPSPFSHRQLPFQIYRPTMQEGEFVGMGEIEPIVDLQYELNTLRSQRRDNATMVLQKVVAYAEGLLDPDDLIWRPGQAIPVFGSPDEVLKELGFSDIPHSGYQEELAIKADLEFASGIAETVAGAGGNAKSAGTATGIQFVQAAADVRVRSKTKMLTRETGKHISAQWLELYRQHTLSDREVIITAPSGPELIRVTPEDFDLVQAVVPEDGSMAAENLPQKRNDSLALFNLTRGNEVVDQRRAMRHLLEAFDVPDAEEWIVPEQEVANPAVMQVVGEALRDTLQRAGMEPEQAEQLALAAMEQAIGASGISSPPSQNGQPAPQEAPVA